MSDWTPVTEEVKRLWAEYQAVAAAKSHFTKLEKELKPEILSLLGYDPDDPKPQPLKACTEDGEQLFEVKIGSTSRPDVSYLKTAYPHIYAEIEKKTPTKSIRSAQG